MPEDKLVRSQQSAVAEQEVVAPEEQLAERERQAKDVFLREFSGELGVMYAEISSGPVPHPRIAKGWAELVPDAPERFLRMAEIEQQERHAIEREKIRIIGAEARSSAWLGGRAQILGFLLLVVIVVIAWRVAESGQGWAAVAIVLGSVVTYAGIAFAGRRATTQKSESGQQTKEKE